MEYFTFEHKAGYGRDDHMAGEIIARACRQLDADTSGYIAASCGFVSHAIPMDGVNVRIERTNAREGAKIERRMRRALRAAYAEVRSRDTHIYVSRRCREIIYQDGESVGVKILEHTGPRRWNTISVEYFD